MKCIANDLKNPFFFFTKLKNVKQITTLNALKMYMCVYLIKLLKKFQ